MKSTLSRCTLAFALVLALAVVSGGAHAAPAKRGAGQLSPLYASLFTEAKVQIYRFTQSVWPGLASDCDEKCQSKPTREQRDARCERKVWRVGTAWAARLSCRLAKGIRVACEVDPEWYALSLGNGTYLADARGLRIRAASCDLACQRAALRVAPDVPAKLRATTRGKVDDANGQTRLTATAVKLGRRTVRAWCLKHASRMGVEGGQSRERCFAPGLGLLRDVSEAAYGTRNMAGCGSAEQRIELVP